MSEWMCMQNLICVSCACKRAAAHVELQSLDQQTAEFLLIKVKCENSWAPYQVSKPGPSVQQARIITIRPPSCPKKISFSFFLGTSEFSSCWIVYFTFMQFLVGLYFWWILIVQIHKCGGVSFLRDYICPKTIKTCICAVWIF